MAYKFYFLTMRNNKFQVPEGKVFCKFGITHQSDVLRRFNPDVDDGYFKSPKYLDWDIKPDQKLAIVMGNEVDGVSDEALALSDVAIEIPQYGTKHSLNVSVCTGVVLWEVSRKLRS